MHGGGAGEMGVTAVGPEGPSWAMKVLTLEYGGVLCHSANISEPVELHTGRLYGIQITSNSRS